MESHTKKMAADSCLGGQSYSTANEVHHFSIQSELTVAILGTMSRNTMLPPEPDYADRMI